ncbi:metal-dependent hydrolase [Saccharothrix isguenensis]
MQSPSVITYPCGETQCTAEVIAVVPLPSTDGDSVVVLDRTCFHPLDHTWPDQPSDAGHLLVGSEEIPVIDGVTCAFDADGELAIGEAIPARRGDDGYRFVVGHVVRVASGALPVGTKVEVRVDEGLRADLSAGHSACHVAAMALNQVTDGYWSKESRRDSRGYADFDNQFVTTSRIGRRKSTDTYRIGKSARKKGLRAQEVLDALPAIEAELNELLRDWVAAGGAITLTPEVCALDAKREWSADLGGNTATIPCGGTHLSDVAQLSGLSVQLVAEDSGITMLTAVD